MRQFLSLLAVLTCFVWNVSSQNVAIGQWKSHLPYNATMSVVDAGDRVYCANNLSVFSYNKTDFSYERLSTTAGFSDVGIKGIFYDDSSESLVITYTNSNIDFVLDGQIINFPFIKTSNVAGDKNIYCASFKGDTVILSCGFGIVLFDTERKESPATYYFTDTAGANFRVNASTVFDHFIYAATANGVYRGSLDNPLLENFNSWEKIDGDAAPADSNTAFITAFNGELYALQSDTVLVSDGDTWNNFFYEPGWHTMHLYNANDHLLITQAYGLNNPPDSARVVTIDTEGEVSITQSATALTFPQQSTIDDAGMIWIADLYRGLVSVNGSEYQYYLPNGPASSKVFDMNITNNIVWVAPGEISPSWIYEYNPDGFFVYEYGNWLTYNKYFFPALDSMFDFLAVEVDKNTNLAYLGSYGGGLLEFDKNTLSTKVYKQGYIQPTVGDESKYRVAGLKLDAANNLWISNFGADNPICVKKADGTWKTFTGFSLDGFDNQVAQIVIDDFNRKWVQMPRGNGILVLNDNNTIDDESDDQVKFLSSGAGNGNLHTNYVNCLVRDKQGEIWVGTSEGVTIFYNPSEVFSGSTAGDATQPLVNLGGYYEQLLRNDIINTIAVDGANRKWVGTNSGAFLISEDGTEQLLYFNQDNSPLFSNTILNIEIDGVTGEVYFGTDKGIISYRYTATEGVEEIDKVQVFPNPVREDYTGIIAINGLTQDAEIRITDVSGRMIYGTTALGGQAIWDGKGYNGERAQTGVYLVYSSNEDGSQTYVAKILVVN